MIMANNESNNETMINDEMTINVLLIIVINDNDKMTMIMKIMIM